MDPRYWKRQVEADSAPWLNAMNKRLEENRQQALKRQKESQATKDGGNNDSAKSSGDVVSDRADDLAEYRAIAQSAASFMPARHCIMCCGRPMVVLWCGLESISTTMR